jgi:hypothetical protein
MERACAAAATHFKRKRVFVSMASVLGEGDSMVCQLHPNCKANKRTYSPINLSSFTKGGHFGDSADVPPLANLRLKKSVNQVTT